MKALVYFLLLTLPLPLFSQKPLPAPLKELSGLVFINDSIMVGHNDGGDRPVLYFINKKAELVHQCLLTNVSNVDWEDITYDGSTYLYIGDFGNNENKRKDLKIIRVSAKSAYTKDEVEASSFEFTYPEQKSFPPSLDQKYFDAEALSYYKGDLYIFTKCRTEPWDGKSQVYKLSTKMENQKAERLSPLIIGKNGWWQDAVTGVDIRKDRCYVMTYNRVMIYRIVEGQLKFERRFYLDPITQKEAIAVASDGTIFIGDEDSKLIGGGYLYEYPNNDK